MNDNHLTSSGPPQDTSAPPQLPPPNYSDVYPVPCPETRESVLQGFRNDPPRQPLYGDTLVDLTPVIEPGCSPPKINANHSHSRNIYQGGYIGPASSGRPRYACHAEPGPARGGAAAAVRQSRVRFVDPASVTNFRIPEHNHQHIDQMHVSTKFCQMLFGR